MRQPRGQFFSVRYTACYVSDSESKPAERSDTVACHKVILMMLSREKNGNRSLKR